MHHSLSLAFVGSNPAIPAIYTNFNLISIYYADVAELADALDLGSSVPDVKVQVLSPAPSIDKREWLSGRASPCQGERREFESRLPLQRV